MKQKDKLIKIGRIAFLWLFVWLIGYIAPNPFMGLMMLLAMISSYEIWREK